MLVRPNVVIIGAASRNVGKTELACELIRRTSAWRRVVGIKVTAVNGGETACPRGGAGCGVCSSLREPYLITTEDCVEGDKDTARMLRAGAGEVLWLRVQRDHLEEGVRDLLSRVPEDVLVICESNSVRAVLEPGLFLVVRRQGDPSVKPSCASVLDHADRILEFTGAGWDLDPNQIVVTPDGWALRPEATAIILAGGESRRMGGDKSLLDVGGMPLIQRVADQLAYFPQRLISANEASKYEFLGLPVVPDLQPGQGPLMGIASCLVHADHAVCFVTGCDIPRLHARFVLGLIELAKDCDIVMPRLPDGRTEPLLAVYRKSLAPLARDLLQAGTRRIVALLDRALVRYVPFENPDWYGNLNTREQFLSWLDAQRMAGELL